VHLPSEIPNSYRPAGVQLRSPEWQTRSSERTDEALRSTPGTALGPARVQTLGIPQRRIQNELKAYLSLIRTMNAGDQSARPATAMAMLAALYRLPSGLYQLIVY
jgi:hypothetical protein